MSQSFFGSVSKYLLIFSANKNVVFICFIFIVVRGVLPRYRYDQLMDIGWKVFIPITLGWLVFISGILISFEMLPNFIQL